MGDAEFRFKQFAIRQQPDAGMKVGTDGVLLGAWSRIEASQRRLLDVGTGTGLVALMAAQRAPHCFVDALEIEPGAAHQAFGNITASPWKDRITVINKSLQEYTAAIYTVPGSDTTSARGSLRNWSKRPPRYDHIISNPPYFDEELLSPSAARTTARHTCSLSFEELCSAASALLLPGGLLSVVLPADRGDRFCKEAGIAGLSLSRLTEVSARESKSPKRVLMEFIKGGDGCEVVHDALSIMDAEGVEFTPEYQALTREFYLKF